MATVGYMEGTDPLILTRLNLDGIGTTPLGNGFDGHGKYVGHLTKQDVISLVITYLHKILPTTDMPIGARDFLSACRTHDIPVVVLVPEDKIARAQEILGEQSKLRLTMVSPEKAYDTVIEILGQEHS
ncbi:MAG: hypothetical protein JXB47_14975 [Anaerolineae bacterium]|nr:hypothetical protein [Anaerolineae bacterium]